MAKFEYMQRAFSSELKPRARLVLQVLVLHCNKEGECFPSNVVHQPTYHRSIGLLPYRKG